MGNSSSSDNGVEEGWLSRFWNWVKDVGEGIFNYITLPRIEAAGHIIIFAASRYRGVDTVAGAAILTLEVSFMALRLINDLRQENDEHFGGLPLLKK